MRALAVLLALWLAKGPAIVEQPDTTTVMPPGTSCTTDNYGNLVIKIER